VGAEFIKEGRNKSSINKAEKQEKQLAYFTVSKLQDDLITPEYISQWAERKFETSDYFLNYVKSVFKTENFLTFYKYLRYPLPTTKLINNSVVPNLKRVFHSDDSHFDYSVNGVDTVDFIKDLDIVKFDEKIFDAMLYKHNSILLTDLSSQEANMPFRTIVDIEDVQSIDYCYDEIQRIAIRASVVIEEKQVNGFLLVDSNAYAFYDKDHRLISEIPHDLGYTPAHFISPRKFNEDPIVRESLFSYIREELEEYVFLKTLQKMTEPNGAIPVTTYLESVDDNSNPDLDGRDYEPSTEDSMSSQRAQIYKTVAPKSQGHLQTGTSIGVPPSSVTDEDGKINMDVVKNFLNFFYIPTEALSYLNDRIKELEGDIIKSLVGDFLTGDEEAKNESQVKKGLTVLENTLRQLSVDLSRIRTMGDTDFLNLKYGPDRVLQVSIFYGSDFFLETEEMLYANFEIAPNPIERKNILIQLTQSKYKNNPDKVSRQKILYNLLPYVSDKDFDVANSKGVIDPIIFEYQTRFNYWISAFEAEFGNIVDFFKGLEGENSEKFIIINNLVVNIIKTQTNESIPNSDV
jgi:hypothetical protein